MKATLKKRQAPVLQRAKPCLVRKPDQLADRNPDVAFLGFQAILPEVTPIFAKYSGGGQTKTS
eukprot:8408528-Alexandrium_andersonii.AAC.1